MSNFSGIRPRGGGRSRRALRCFQSFVVAINGSGGTTLMEQFIVLRAVKKELDGMGIELARCIVDELLTVQEMAGFQMFVAKMDDELIKLWDAPCDTPAMTVS